MSGRSADGTDRERPGNCVSVFPYPGGKGRECSWILSRMPAHDCYVEVFGGSGALLYNKPESTVEVYNDVNDDLVQFFETLREREDELVQWLRNVPYSRSLYLEWVDDYFDGVRPSDPVERAGRFYALRYMQFAGDISMKNGFKTRAKRSPARTFDNARERLEEIADRFRQVIIENQDYSDILSRYDDTDVDVVFYCDPPYVGGEHYYQAEFNHSEFVDALRDVESKWMVSYTELPEGLDEYYVVERDRRHRMCREASDTTERLVCNFDPTSTAQFVDDDQTQTKLTEMKA
ncbi:DNA adenine methylase [Halosolutus gelatinilyticus]|uniref:DNA adenine methylase n=1 Tax=Halosolutus gelatinilyticus TaxID=2931975 RepID=UPI002111FB02|nr:DNA adenine methylase [Halosolutus gelatinilyticus]